MQGIVDNDRPPYVVFERRAIEDRSKTLSEGLYGTKDVDYATITRPGSRDTLVKEAVIWLRELRERAKSGQVPANWSQHFDAAYKDWLAGEEGSVQGHPIKGWGQLPPSAQTDLINIGVKTIEDLANMSDNDLRVIGTGSLSLKQKAIAYLAAGKDVGKIAEQVAEMSTKLDSLTELARTQAIEIERLRVFEPKSEKPKAETF